MQKKIYHLMAMLMLCLICGGFLTSCGDDDDEPKDDNLIEKLQGTWTFDVMKINVVGQTIEMNRQDLVNESGYNNFYDDVLTFNGQKVNGSNFQIDGNKILLPWYEDMGWWQSVSFSGNKMTLLLYITYEGIPMKMWITYVKSNSRASYVPADNTMTLLPFFIQRAIK